MLIRIKGRKRVKNCVLLLTAHIMIVSDVVIHKCNAWLHTNGCRYKIGRHNGVKNTSKTKLNCRFSIAARSISRRSAVWMMPEGPEVRRLVDQLQPAVGMKLTDIRLLSGRYITHEPPAGYDELRASISKRMKQRNDIDVDIIKEWNVKGKFMWIVLDQGSENSSTIQGDASRVCKGKRTVYSTEKETSAPVDVTTSDSGDYLRSIWITLGMTGRFINAEHPDAGSALVRWTLECMDITNNAIRRLYYHDARNFGTLKMSSSRKDLEKKLASIGPDMLSDELTDDSFLEIMSKQNANLNICKFLMDQKKISGIGNYLLSEGLYKANIDPFVSLGELNDSAKRNLYGKLKQTSNLSYASQGLTLSGGSYKDIEAKRGTFEFELQCYGRKRCPRGNAIIRDTRGPHGRSIWYVKDQLSLPLNTRNTNTSTHLSREDNFVQPVLPVEENNAVIRTQISQVLSGENLALQLNEMTWKSALYDFLRSEKFQDLSSFLDSEREVGGTIYPPPAEIFAALNMCPADKVKVVIVGQDPYHGPGQAHGLAFSVRREKPLPPSLRNIFAEAIKDVGIAPPLHGNLEHWAKQGVLLINTVLTVRRSEANSHANKGWEQFTDHVLKVLTDGGHKSLVFLLWGATAVKKASIVDQSKHIIIHSSHPSPLSASKTAHPFLGSNCFSRTNDALTELGIDTIDWSIP